MQTDEISLRHLLKAFRFFGLAAILLVTALLMDPLAHRKEAAKIKPSQVERDFHRKLDLLNRKGSDLLEMVKVHSWPKVLEANPGFGRSFSDENDGIALFLLRNDTLLFWSDNSLVVSDSDLVAMKSNQFYTLPNCQVYVRTLEREEYRLVGMTFLKKFFPYNNEFVSNAFLVGKNIPASYQLSHPPVPNAIRIQDDLGNYAFTIVPGLETAPRKTLHWITLLFFLSSFLFVLAGFSDLMRLGYRLKPTGLWLAGLLVDLFLVRWLFGALDVPHCVFTMEMFKPFDKPRFLLDSRGGVMVTAVLILYFSWWFSRIFRLFPANLAVKSASTDSRLLQSLGVLGWLIVGGSFLFVHWLTGLLLEQRDGLMEISRILAFNPSTLTDTLVLAGLLVSFLLILFRIVSELKQRISWMQASLSLLIVSGLVFGLARTAQMDIGYYDVGFFLFTTVAMIAFHYSGKRKVGHGFAALMVLAISVFIVHVTDEFNRGKEDQRREEILSRLSNEHDPIAEMLLSQVAGPIQADTVLRHLVTDRTADPLINQSAITSYLKTRYFGLYWNRYEIQARSCDSVSRILIQPDNFEVPCLPYFLGEMRDRYGTGLPGTAGFYYLDNFDGLIDYLGVFRYFTPDSLYGANLIINIDSRLVAQEMGYPELLVTGKFNRDSLYGSYDYAKYHQSKLQSVTGSYPYSLTSEIYPGRIGEIVPFVRDGYHHWIHKIDSNNEVVISRPSIRFVDYVVTFSYVFVFLFLAWVLLKFALGLPKNISFKNLGLKPRIQMTLISILVISFLLIGGGMTYFVIRQYQDSSRKLIVEKTESLLTDIQHKLEKEAKLTRSWHDGAYRSLDELLLKFSYVFNTDMNLYDPQGTLIVSTRPEIFEYNLAGKKMNPLAYEALHYQKRTLFLIRESIESLGYFSSFAPLFNQEGTLLGYMNLPYFSRQTEIRREISTLVIAMLNGYFILILLSIFFTVLLANQVSRPLSQLQDKLAKLRFGKNNLEIDYTRQDEIGSLVKEYNRMVSELQASADKLARSEREVAWREMARQIAHEIKNPLTPMKLSVQHLRRAWKDQAPNLDQHIDKVTHTLIDQIETLSSIASEFSKFAQMPGAHFEPIDLAAKLKRITYLFEDSCRVVLHPVVPSGTEPVVYADPEQLLQVFNNLIRNAIQAVPEGRSPEVDLFIEVADERVRVRVTDNGSGIPDELRDRLFEPNFTTKTSGMGLGLAITKKIVEGSEGRIWFETKTDEGTSFFIEWPLFRAD